MSRILTAGLCLSLFILVSSSMLVCNYDSSAKNRSAQGQFTVSDIDPNLCTHLIYASSDINSVNELVPTNTDDLLDYVSFKGLKTRNPQLKTLLSVGGMKFNIQKFSMMASTPLNRSVFIQSAVSLLRTFGFDGINLDWRFPGSAGSQADDKHKFTLLCKELLGAFETEGNQTNRQRLIVTASVSAEKAVISASYEVAQIATFLDFMNVLTFDFHGPWENVTGHHSPLYQGSQDIGDNIYSNTDYAMQFWQNQGAPAQKLNMGLAAYGRAFTLASSSTGVGAAAKGPAEEGCYTGEMGFWAYYETCLYIEGGLIQWIADQKVPYAVTEGQWVGFDNQGSVAIKVNYLKANNFGGAFVWSLDLDDFRGDFCKQGINPFITYLGSLILDFTTTPAPTTTTTPAPTTTTTPAPTTTTTPAPTTTTTPAPTTTTIPAPTTTTTPTPMTTTPPPTTTTTLAPTTTTIPAPTTTTTPAPTTTTIPAPTTTTTPAPTTTTTPAPTTTTIPAPTTTTTPTPMTTTPEPTTTTTPTPMTTTPAPTTTTTPPPTTIATPHTNHTTTITTPCTKHTLTTTTPATTTTTPAPTTTTPAPTILLHTNTTRTEATSTTSLATTTTIATCDGCSTSFCTGKNDGNYINPDDPNTFYQCSNGLTYIQQCQANLVYKLNCNCCDYP